MQTVLTSNNAYMSILVVDENDVVVSAFGPIGDRELITYATQGADADLWDTNNWPAGFDPDDATPEDATKLRTISEYGREIGRNGAVDDYVLREKIMQLTGEFPPLRA